jgi:hypothetical protein
LESCWQQAKIVDGQIRVMLNAVTFIDSGGKKLLAKMHREGAELAGQGCMTKAIIEGIIRGENL